MLRPDRAIHPTVSFSSELAITSVIANVWDHVCRGSKQPPLPALGLFDTTDCKETDEGELFECRDVRQGTFWDSRVQNQLPLGQQEETLRPTLVAVSRTTNTLHPLPQRLRGERLVTSTRALSNLLQDHVPRNAQIPATVHITFELV